jgi:L-2,4-diaminobutyrate decarboxylase
MYQQIIDDLRRNVFLSDDGDNYNKLIDLIKVAVTSLIEHQGDGPIFPVFETRKISEVISSASIPKKYNFDSISILKNLNHDMQRSVKANSPLMVKNVIPQPSFVYLAAYVAASLYMGNAVSGEDSGEALKAEIACAASIAKLAGMNPDISSGVFTFGGTGTNFYAIKLGLAKVCPEHLLNGISSNNVVVVGNKASHYSQQTAVNWLGIGQLNYRQVKTNIDQTTDLIDLELNCRELLSQGKRIACIEAVGGTTSNMAIDDLEEISVIRNRLVNDFKLDYIPHLHCDSVQGWVWLNFVGYDFETNPLELDTKTLEKVRKNCDKISKLHFADSFGVDFHKTGYVPYNSSMVILKNKDDFNLLKRQKDLMTPLFHDVNEYNPGVFTIETSRSCANILATWVTLKSFGQEGYQVLLSHALKMRELFVNAHKCLNEVGLVIENIDSSSVDVYIRCIKSGEDVKSEHQKELTDNDLLAVNTKYTNHFYEWFTTEFKGPDPKIAFSKSTASFYNHNDTPVVALRFYLLSANNTEQSIEFLINYLINAKKEFDKSYGKSSV